MIYNLGSLNIDYVYTVKHFPGSGETLPATSFKSGLGGKGANQSVAASLAGARVMHIGAVGPERGYELIAQIADYDVDTSGILRCNHPTGHAIIFVDQDAENSIVIYPGANEKQEVAFIDDCLSDAERSDTLLMQNETSEQVHTARTARAKGMRVVYSAAPFKLESVQNVLPYVSVLALNEIEAVQLSNAMGRSVQSLPVPHILMTQGSHGATWFDTKLGTQQTVPAYKVKPIDTTGAGDTFVGYVAAGLDLEQDIETVLQRAAAAAAIQVTHHGAAEAIPNAEEVSEFLETRAEFL